MSTTSLSADQRLSMRLLFLRVSRWMLDVLVLVTAWTLAFAVRFDFALSPKNVDHLLATLPYVVLLQFMFLAGLAVHRASWQYIGMRDVDALIRSMVGAGAVLLATRLTTQALVSPGDPWSHGILPFSIIGADVAFAILGLAGLRFARRAQSERSEMGSRQPSDRHLRTLVVGAGRAGAMISREMQSRPDLGREVIGFVDDDPTKLSMSIHGVPVLGPTRALQSIIEAHDIDDVVIAIANSTGADIRRIANASEDAGISPQILPGLYEIVDGQVSMSRIRPVAIEDLLRRDPVELDTTQIREDMTGDVVLVTGAGGSIGSELCRQVARFQPQRIVLVERAETPLWAIHRELMATFPDVEVVPALVDVCDEEMLRRTFLHHRPTTVFHAAAHKHVMMCERNEREAVNNNVVGTRRVVDAAVDAGVERFVLVSTDKAVNPSSVMGATKRVAERYVQSRAVETGSNFVCVRFGNVLGSNGSVVPIFKQQIAQGGPITVTDPEMTRYFMTIPEASALVVQAASLGTPGDLFVLEMGQPVKILDLALDLIDLSGLDRDDIEITFTGAQSGEKLHEELNYTFEDLAPTSNPSINRHRNSVDLTFTPEQVDALVDSTQAELRDRLFSLAGSERLQAR